MAAKRMPNQKRQLSPHVCSRWYRAPECILLEKNYGQAMYMWSIGCIFAELLHFLTPEAYKPKTSESKLDSRYLVPGDTCYPLSPGKGEDGQLVSFKDQMRHILDVCGKVDEYDKAFISK